MSAAEQAEFDAAVDAAITELPPVYRAVLRLHLAYGHAPAEIAHALDRSPGTVRSQLARGLERLRKLLPLGLLSAAVSTLFAGRGLPAVKQAVLSRATGAGALTGGSIAGVTWKAMLAAAVLAAVGSGVWLSRPPTQDSKVASELTGVGSALLKADLPLRAPSPTPAVDREPSAPAAPEDARSAGTLRVRCRWNDGSHAAGVLVTAIPVGDVLLQRSATTGEDGTVLMADLRAGPARLVADRGGSGKVEVVADVTTDADLVIPAGVDVQGRVVDDLGSPVRHARVWLSTGARNYGSGRHVTTADAAGRFTLRSVEPERFVSADAPGYRAAVVQPVSGGAGDVDEVELVLHGTDATLVGTVVDAEGKLVAGAQVVVGDRDVSNLTWMSSNHAEYRPAQVLLTTDEQGVFRANGLQAGGIVSVWARASGWCAWTQRIALREDGETTVTARLERGATCEGRVTDGAGDPVTGALVTYRPALWLPEGQDFRDFTGPDWAFDTVRSAANGQYRIEHVPPGTLRMLVNALTIAGGLEARGQVAAAAGETVTWNPVLVDQVIRGQVVDERGAPLGGVAVRCDPPRGSGRSWSTTTDASGRFSCGQLAPVRYVLGFHAPGDELHARPAVTLWGVLPGSDEVVVRISDVDMPSASITGVLLDADGRPPAEALVHCSAEGLHGEPTAKVDPLTGHFSLGPLPAGTYRTQFSVGKSGQYSGWSEPIALYPNTAHDLGLIQLPEPGTILVSVTGPNGEPVDGAQVAIEYTTGWSAVLHRATKTERGAARIEGVAPGDHRVQVSGRELPIVYAPISVAAREQSLIQIAVPRSVQCRLVLPPPSEAVPMHLSFVWKRDDALHEVWWNRWESSDEVSWTMQLVPGNWEVLVTSETGLSTVNRFRIDLDDPPGHEIRIALP